MARLEAAAPRVAMRAETFMVVFWVWCLVVVVVERIDVVMVVEVVLELLVLLKTAG